MLKEVKGDIAGMIDMERYSVTVDEERGIAATYARTTERNRNRDTFRRAQHKLKQRNMRALCNSFSTIYTKKGFRAIRGKHWNGDSGILLWRLDLHLLWIPPRYGDARRYG